VPITEALAADVVALRRELHGHPEIGLHLPRTQAAVLARLGRVAALAGEGNLEVSTGRELSSVVAVLRGGAPLPPGTRRPVVLLRGDMDALPVREETGLPYAPAEPGAMHACGHDLHTAGLYGALAHLAEHRDELVADVVGMFQPGEEADGGALPMIEEGLLHAAGVPVDFAYALHTSAAKYPRGVFAARPGTMQSSCDDLIVTVLGRGGHGSTPQLTQDPVPVAAQMVLALQGLVTRQFDVFDPVVVTVGRLTAGTASNIIPDTAELAITMRSFSAAARERLLPAVDRLVRGIADAHGMGVATRVDCAFPVTVNDAAQTAYARGVIEGLFGAGAYLELDAPASGSEDFSEVLDRVPGAYLMYGAAPLDVDYRESPTNHSAGVRFDDAVLPRAVEALAGFALGKGPVAL